MNEALHDLVLERLLDDPKVGEVVATLVDAACHGGEALAASLRGERAPLTRQARAPVRTPRGAYLKSLTVAGFRGIGAAATLDVTPGPGLTVVVGRNGSGKSSLAEGLETLLTGDNRRWSDRPVEWGQGWQNLHHEGPPEIAAAFCVEGASEPVIAKRTWEGGGSFSDSVLTVAPEAGFDALGWAAALDIFRPFLSYNELSALFDKPSGLYDALAAILGLDDLKAATRRLVDARKLIDRDLKALETELTPLLARLADSDDPRAVACHRALSGKKVDLDAADAVLSGGGDEEAGETDLSALRALAALQAPEPTRVAAVVTRLREAIAGLAAVTGSRADLDDRVARLLDAALHLREAFATADCPVCERPAALNDAWAESAAARATELRAAAHEAKSANAALEAATRDARGLIRPAPRALDQAAALGLDASDVVAAWTAWQSGLAPTAPEALASHLEDAAMVLATALEPLVTSARAALIERESAWRPLALLVANWTDRARPAEERRRLVRELKAAEDYVKAVEGDVRDARFSPIAEHARAIWRELAKGSHVDLVGVGLAGKSTSRRVELDVSVDGVDGVALGVMSQGELHALALSLFLPRVALDDSPFRFVAIDDPVQSMDPNRVDGLARVLAGAAKTRQVIVFTHDLRLSEAIERLQIPADVRRVQRRGRSVIEIQADMSPVKRYLNDAYKVAAAQDKLGEAVAARVVPGLCRLALEAALTTAIRRRRLGRGEDHVAVERLIGDAHRLYDLASIAIFDTRDRTSELLKRLNNQLGSKAVDAFKAINSGAHGDWEGGDYVGLLQQAKRLAGHFEAQA